MNTAAERKGAPVHSLGARYYTDPKVFAREKEAVFFKTWQFAGHAADIAEAGDYFTFSIADQNLFCVRGADGDIRCFYNVCQHRAHPLLEGAGSKRLLVCPYHAWSYELDGRLRKAPNSESTPGFDAAEICLSKVKTENFLGFIFVNLDSGAAAMDDWFPGVRAELAEFLPGLDDLKLMKWTSVEESCNWKISVENYSECYHCQINHPTFSTGVADPKSYNVRPQGYCLRHTTAPAPNADMSYEYDASLPHASEYSSWFLWPMFSFQVYPGNTLNTYLWRAVDHETTIVHRGWHTPGGVETETALRLAEQDFNTTVLEDVRLVNAVHQGMKSRGYRPGPLVLDPNEGVMSEHSIRALQGWLLEALAAQEN
ncbi:MAG: aromatic ring-hydroxylating oxygenase subunit alpha [Rhodospirillales bacterium]